MPRGHNFIDIKGQTFDRLTVLERDYSRKDRVHWWCQCSCNKKSIISVSAKNLRNGNTKSCGCLKRENTIKRLKKYNTYDLSGEYGVGYTAKDEEFYFDLEDFEKIKDYRWYLDSHDGYLKTNVKMKILLMHRIVMNVTDKSLIIDHIFHVNHDNRKSQLRIATSSENSMNSVMHKDNTSGVTGVGWRKETKKWRAYIGVNRKFIELGYFDNFEDAVKIRKDAEKEYFGEFAYKNN